jgi:phospholipid/cholesterol/gamma-HCH transport system substrate-binding protein
MAAPTTEVKVGIFVFLGLLILIYMTATVGKWNLGQDKGYLVTTKLDSATGLMKDSPVKVLGVTQGKVEALAIDQGKAIIHMRLPGALTLPEDSLVFLRSESLLGENYVEIKPGSPEKPPVIDGGELLQGAPPADIDQLISELGGVATEIKKLTQTINQPVDTFNEKENQGAFESIVDNLEATSGSLKNLSQRIERGEGTLGKLLTDASLYNDLKKTLSDMGTAINNLSSSEGTLVKLFQDDEIYRDIKEITARLNAIISKTERGEGLVGRLFIENRNYVDQSAGQESEAETPAKDSEYVPLTALGGMLGEVTK